MAKSWATRAPSQRRKGSKPRSAVKVYQFQRAYDKVADMRPILFVEVRDLCHHLSGHSIHSVQCVRSSQTISKSRGRLSQPLGPTKRWKGR
jgi:hypothetical protein